MNDEFPPKAYKLNYPYVEAIEVTGNYVASLPNAGSNIQRFGEQVEIMGPAPLRKKTYAQVGEYIVVFKDANDNVSYGILSAIAFRGLFAETSREVEGWVEEVATPELTQAEVEELIPLESDSSSLTPKQKKALEREKRLAELADSNVDSFEAPLGSTVEKE